MKEGNNMDKKQIDTLGYDQEEVYFAKLNRELLKNLKSKTCPSCSGKLEIARIDGADVVQCRSCGSKLTTSDAGNQNADE